MLGSVCREQSWGLHSSFLPGGTCLHTRLIACLQGQHLRLPAEVFPPADLHCRVCASMRLVTSVRHGAAAMELNAEPMELKEMCKGHHAAVAHRSAHDPTNGQWRWAGLVCWCPDGLNFIQVRTRFL